MQLSHIPRRGLAGAALALLALGACAEDPELIIVDPNESPAIDPIFTRYVALGNSISAGYQSGGINDSTQQESFARLLAQQFETPYRYARLTMPGCPSPTANFLTGARVGAPNNPACALLVDPAGGVLNNVAVPGAAVADPTAGGAGTQASNALTTLFLSGKTQVERALDANPTFVTIWIGNNDALQAAATGLLTPTAGVSRGLTDSTLFKTEYNEMLTQLTTANPQLEGALISVVNTTAIPLLFPVAVLLQSPQAYGGFAQATGGDPNNPAGTLPIHPNCGTAAAPANYLVSFAIAAQIRLYRQTPTAAGAHPPLISCGNAVGTPAANSIVGDIFMLSPTEIGTLTSVVSAYNNHIATRANELGWAYVDVNPTLNQVRLADAAPGNPNQANPRIAYPFPRLDIAAGSGGTRSPFGTWFSFDGAHPARDAHVAIANLIIAAINDKYDTSVPTCTLASVDPPVCQ
jgi:lysophospholipase L1-like esterase